MKTFSASALLLIVAAIASGCTQGGDPAVGATTITPEHWPTTNGGLPLDPAIEARIDEIMATMTLEELVAQTIQGDINSLTPDDVRQYRLGSVLNGGNSAPGFDVRAPAQDWLALADAFWEASMDTTGGRKPIPVLWGTDAVHGNANVVGATIFPHNIGLGAANNPDLMREIGKVTAREIRVTGQEWTFAPTLAVVRNDRWGRTYEGFSEDGEIVAAFAPAIIEGLQGVPGTAGFLGDDKVVASAKHFMGDGGTDDGIDQGNNTSDEADFRDIQGAGYPPAIEAGAQAIMVSYNSWHGQKMHGYKTMLTDVLKGRMAFNGFVVGDWNGHGQVEGCDPTSCAASMNAGLDMFMAPDTWKPLYHNTLAQVESGEIPLERLHDAVRRILRVKLRMGLFEMPRPSERPLAGDWDLLGAPDHLAVARQAVRESLVLLKNNDNVLPIQPGMEVLVAGDAGSLGKAAGGWTLSWQGTGNENHHFPNGRTIWEGIRDAVSATGGRAMYASDGQLEGDTPDVAIVVFGEEPYAEMFGDRPNVDYRPTDGLEILQYLRGEGIPTVAVFLSGRPLWVNPELNEADAFVAAWLPGTQGDGVADVLIAKSDGSVNHDFKGRLSFSWPATATQTPLNRGTEGYDPLFAYGYGLTYSSSTVLTELPEASGLTAAEDLQGIFFSRGAITDPLALEVTAAGASTRVVDANQTVGGVQIASVDRAAQEDSKRFTWSGEGEAGVALTGSDGGLLTPSAQSIDLQFRVDQRPDGPVSVYVDCGEECKGSWDITQVMTSAPLGEWHTVKIPLQCLVSEDGHRERLSTVFGLRTNAPFSVSVSDVRLSDLAASYATCGDV